MLSYILICSLHHHLNSYFSLLAILIFFQSFVSVFFFFFINSYASRTLSFHIPFLTTNSPLSFYFLFSVSPRLHNDLFVNFSLPTKQSRLSHRQFSHRMISPPPRHFLHIPSPSRRQVLHSSGEPLFLTLVQHNLFHSLAFNSLAAHEDLNTGISSRRPARNFFTFALLCVLYRSHHVILFLVGWAKVGGEVTRVTI